MGEAFGRERIWARDTESNGVSSCLGRLIRIFRSNGLRCDEETNDQYLEEDVAQHLGSRELGVKGSTAISSSGTDSSSTSSHTRFTGGFGDARRGVLPVLDRRGVRAAVSGRHPLLPPLDVHYP